MDKQMKPVESEELKSGKLNFWIYAIIAVVVVLVIVWYADTKKKSAAPLVQKKEQLQNFQSVQQPTDISEEKVAATIEFTDSGFSPQNVTIKSGEAVQFVNTSSSGMWVASAPHPTHTDYPEFDAKKVYNKGETFSFTFEKTGTWKFHNHLDPTKFGSVTVQ